MSRLCNTRTPCMHDSNTWAPCEPNALPLKSKYRPAVDSLHANPNSRCFNASNGSLQPAIFKCFKLSELVKNCLKDGGISLPFFVLNELCDTFKWAKCVEQPRSKAPNNCVDAETKMIVCTQMSSSRVKSQLHFPEMCPYSIDPSVPEHSVEQGNCTNSVYGIQNRDRKIQISFKIQHLKTHINIIF